MRRWLLVAAIAFAIGLGAEASGAAAGKQLVRLKAAAFDPLSDSEPDLPELIPVGLELRPATESAWRYFLIQFEGPATAAVQDDLIARGAEILESVPYQTLLVRLPAGRSENLLRAAPTRRFVGAFRPAYKISPEVLGLLDEPGSSAVTLDVSLFRGEDPERLIHAIEDKLEAVRITFVRRREPMRMTLELPGKRLGFVVGSLIRDPAVYFVEQRPQHKLHNDHAAWTGQSYDRSNGPAEALEPDPKPYAQSATLWNQGLFGAGQVVAVADTGLESAVCFFDDPGNPVVPQSVTPPGALTIDNSHRKILAVNGTSANALLADDTYRHGTHVAGTVAGDNSANLVQGSSAGHDHGDGMAPAAKIIFEDIGPTVNGACSTTIAVNSVLDLLDQEYDAGARISTNSWGSGSGTYTAGTREVDTAIWENEDFLVVFSAGNDGAGGLANEAACKNCVAVGATENYDGGFLDPFGILDPENMTAFSSRGPAADGRLKPDLSAPGFLVRSARFPVQYKSDVNDPLCDAGNPDVCFPSFGGCYITDSSSSCHVDLLLGTSMSTPIVAGLAALAREYFIEGFYPTGQANAPDSMVPSAALLKAILLNGARNMTGHLYERRGGAPADFGPLADAPSDVQGWGRVMLDDALYFSGDARRLVHRDVANSAGLMTGESSSLAIGVTASDQPLEVTLTWTDPPGSLAPGAALVNDLDLRVTAPDGTIYRGNQWNADNINVPGDKESAANPVETDALNSVESVLIQTPQVGVYDVAVLATDVPGFQGMKKQGFGLVVTGDAQEVGPTPPPVPDGTFGSPATAARVDVAGTTIDLTWDVGACVAADYHLLYGDLASVATLALSGSVCDLGISGTHTWAGVPIGDTWFLIVGDDDAQDEGSWGTGGGGTQRLGTTPSGQCLITTRDNSGTCP